MPAHGGWGNQDGAAPARSLMNAPIANRRLWNQGIAPARQPSPKPYIRIVPQPGA